MAIVLSSAVSSELGSFVASEECAYKLPQLLSLQTTQTIWSSSESM